jgi:hypothetical protein
MIILYLLGHDTFDENLYFYSTDPYPSERYIGAILSTPEAAERKKKKEKKRQRQLLQSER